VLPYRDATGSGAAQLALAAGVPVVATRAGGLADAIDDGVTGFLVEPGDVAGLAAAIERFFVEERAADFRRAIQDQHQRFSWSSISQAVQDLAAVPRA
jgi:glycosyltransferase involved in cell wall biosynthesis